MAARESRVSPAHGPQQRDWPYGRREQAERERAERVARAEQLAEREQQRAERRGGAHGADRNDRKHCWRTVFCVI